MVMEFERLHGCDSLGRDDVIHFKSRGTTSVNCEGRDESEGFALKNLTCFAKEFHVLVE